MERSSIGAMVAMVAAMGDTAFGAPFEYKLSAPPSWEPPNRKGKKMPSIRVYRGARLLKEDGTKSSFYVDHSNTVYEDFDGTVRKVGRMSGDGKLNVKAKYLAKYGKRLKQIASPKEASNGKQSEEARTEA